MRFRHSRSPEARGNVGIRFSGRQRPLSVPVYRRHQARRELRAYDGKG